jgi:hypothetical protein
MYNEHTVRVVKGERNKSYPGQMNHTISGIRLYWREVLIPDSVNN